MITRVKIKGLYVWLELKETEENNYHCYYYFREPSHQIQGIPLLDKNLNKAAFTDLETALMMGITVTENKILNLPKHTHKSTGNRYN
jgi:hypothetical protein